MLRLTWRSSGWPPKLLSENEFIKEVQQMATRNFAGAPAGPVLVEALDARSCVGWRGYYEGAAGLIVLLRQLLAEDEIAAGSGVGGCAPPGPGGVR
jgi:hypothetical protein